MLDRKDRTQNALFIPGSLVDHIPKDHILKQADKVLDLSWLREEVADCYDLTNGRPGRKRLFASCWLDSFRASSMTGN